MGLCSLYESIFTVDVSPELAVGVHNCATFDQQPPPIITLHDNMEMIYKLFGSITTQALVSRVCPTFNFHKLLADFSYSKLTIFGEIRYLQQGNLSQLRRGTPHHVCESTK